MSLFSLKFNICFWTVLSIQLIVSSFGFIDCNKSELHHAGIALVLLSTDLIIFFASLGFNSFTKSDGPRWYKVNDL